MSSLSDDHHENEEGSTTLEEPLLSESLVGLIGAFDKLKETMGYSEGNQDENMIQIQSYVESIRDENETLRQHAEDAITMAQRYKEAYDELADENAGLYEKLTQASVNDMVMHTHELSSVAYEYDKEFVTTKIAQAEEMVAHAYEMQQRIDELEEENMALKQTLHELREDQKQFYALRKMDMGALRDSDDTPSPLCESPSQEKSETKLDESETPVVAAQSPIQESTPMSKMNNTPGSSAYVTPLNSTTKKDDPLAVAEALAAVAAGSESGMAASASKMLRSYHSLQEELDEVRERNKVLVKENQELTETMTSKQFKAPSAWAEREVKYKLERKEWEEDIRAKELKIVDLEKENRKLRSNTGTDDLNQKIIDLEAQLVVLQRDCENSKAALHDMQVSSMLSAGEFSMSGAKPFSRHDDVHSIIDKIESESESHEVSSNAPASLSTANAQYLAEELKDLQKEKMNIMSKLADIENENPVTEFDAANCEIALLENGIDIDAASKILDLEMKLNQASDKNQSEEPSIQEEISSVSDMLRTAFRSAETRGDTQALQVINAMHLMQPIKTLAATSLDDDPIVQPQMLTEEAQNRIKELKVNIMDSTHDAHEDDCDPQKDHEEKDKEPSKSTGKETLGMKPQAAAALAAVNRAQGQDIESLKRQLQEFSKRESALKTEIEKARSTDTSATMQQRPSDSFDNQAKADFAALLREKAEIETKFDMTKLQLARAQQALDEARQEQASLQKAIKAAIASGEMNNVETALTAKKQASKKKLSSPLKKMKGKGIFSMRKGSGSRPGSGSSEDQNLRLKAQPSTPDARQDDEEQEGDPPSAYQLATLQDENDMLMDQLVTTKVRLAEVEGECLQSKRALVRAREKQMELARQLHNERASHVVK